MTESLVLNLISLTLSLLLFFILLHPFDSFTGRNTYTGIALTGNYWVLFSVLFVAGTVLSGLYPAFVLSGFKPIVVLKGAFKTHPVDCCFAKSLIVVQFVISVVLIAGTVIVYQQVNYMRSQSIGANLDQTIVLKGPQTLPDSLYQGIYQPFKSEVLQQASVKSITASTNVMGDEIYWTNGSKDRVPIKVLSHFITLALITILFPHMILK